MQKRIIQSKNPYINVIPVNSERFDISKRIKKDINYKYKIKNLIIYLPFENQTSLEMIKSFQLIEKHNKKIQIYLKIHKNNKNNQQILKKIQNIKKYLVDSSFSFYEFDPENTIILSALSTIQIDLLFSGFRLFNMNINNNKHLKPYNINVLQIKNITSSQISHSLMRTTNTYIRHAIP